MVAHDPVLADNPVTGKTGQVGVHLCAAAAGHGTHRPGGHTPAVHGPRAHAAHLVDGERDFGVQRGQRGLDLGEIRRRDHVGQAAPRDEGLAGVEPSGDVLHQQRRRGQCGISRVTGAALYLAEALVTRPDLFSDYHGQRTAPEMLGLAASDTLKTAVAKLPATGDSRALVIMLGVVLATTEARVGSAFR